MISTNRTRQSYGHRLRALVRSSGNTSYATQIGVPRSTAHGWLTSNPVEIVTVDVVDMDLLRLQKEVLTLRKRMKWILALFRLLVALMKVSGFSLDNSRLPEGAQKARLLRAIDLSLPVLPLRVALRLLRLSPSRYHSWKNDKECGLDDMSSCPRTSPQQLTRSEINTIQDMVTSEEYRHVPTSRLAILAQRLGKVFASPATWFRLVQLYKWRRPRRRIHPAKPKVGIRAFVPNEIWHVDTTLIRLLNGSHVYLHAVIDSFSRRILSWRVSGTFEPPAGRFPTPPLVSQSTITDGNWHRIGFVWDGSYRHLYVDGAEVASDVTPLSNLEDSSNGLNIGTGKDMAPGSYFSGLIDDVRVYNRAVSP